MRDIAREIADKVKKNATIDWTIRESARAKLAEKKYREAEAVRRMWPKALGLSPVA